MYQIDLTANYLSMALQPPVHAWTVPEDPTGVLRREKGKIGCRPWLPVVLHHG